MSNQDSSAPKEEAKENKKDRRAGKWKKNKLPFNPVEGLVLLMFVGIFTLSAYRFLYNWDDLDGTQASGFSNSSDRELASSFNQTITIDCEKDQSQDTSHAVIQLDGKLCGFESPNTSPLKTSEIVNLEDKPVATLFTDENAGTFLTNEIHLKSGENQIRIKFSYKDGRVVTRQININKVL